MNNEGILHEAPYYVVRKEEEEEDIINGYGK